MKTRRDAMSLWMNRRWVLLDPEEGLMALSSL